MSKKPHKIDPSFDKIGIGYRVVVEAQEVMKEKDTVAFGDGLELEIVNDLTKVTRQNYAQHKGKVVCIGPLCFHQYPEEYRDELLQIGDTVYFPSASGHHFVFDDRHFFVVDDRFCIMREMRDKEKKDLKKGVNKDDRRK